MFSNNLSSPLPYCWFIVNKNKYDSWTRNDILQAFLTHKYTIPVYRSPSYKLIQASKCSISDSFIWHSEVRKMAILKTGDLYLCGHLFIWEEERIYLELERLICFSRTDQAYCLVIIVLTYVKGMRLVWWLLAQKWNQQAVIKLQMRLIFGIKDNQKQLSTFFY